MEVCAAGTLHCNHILATQHRSEESKRKKGKRATTPLAHTDSTEEQRATDTMAEWTRKSACAEDDLRATKERKREKKENAGEMQTLCARRD